jgi:Na+/serine symporter
LYCGTSVYDLSFNNITIGSFLGLLAWALVYGLVYKDLGKRKKAKP